MPQRHLSLTRDPRVASERASLEARLRELRGELDLPERFSPEALAEAESAAVEPPGLDLREIPFTTLDPAGSRDLDQAFHLERAGSGFAVRYAIADVPGFVRPGGAVDAEARRRGQTIYLPDGSIPLHPRTLSEGRASLLAGEDRPALVWTIELDAAGAQTSARVERALVRSREQRDYVGAQAEIDAGRHDEQLELLRVVGELRIGQERARGGASLPMPEEEVVVDPDDGYRIERRSPLPVEEWNAQLSLLTGMAAAGIMLSGGVGILRTMPAPDEASLARFRAEVAEIGSPWAAGVRYGDYLRGVDPAAPRGMEILEAATSLFRGAGYTPFDGAIPELTTQAALAAPYAHVTAPLRRLVDRWGLAICLALCEGDEVPDWTRSSLADLPALMRAAGQRASRAEGAAIDLVEEACAASASRAA